MLSRALAIRCTPARLAISKRYMGSRFRETVDKANVEFADYDWEVG